MTGFAARACWSAENAKAVLVTEALAGDDALFLATHSPVRGFEVGGSAKDVEGDTEEALLRALSESTRQHAFCVVQGEPGSGKSHLIRWLDVNWPQGRDFCLLVQRANGSLEGALRQLQARLPAEFQPLFDKLGRRQAAGVAGRANSFLLQLGAALEPDHFTKQLQDVDWCEENEPAALILNAEVRRHWSGPLRILELMDGAAGERNSETASFNLEDMVDLARYCPQVHDSVASERLARRIIREVEFLIEARSKGWTFDQIRVEHAQHIRSSLALIDALNARRNYAVQHVIGVSADGLKTLFEDLRIALGQRGQRLVLLLEDITSWEGLDDSLVDALVTDAQTRPDSDLCPLISVVGVTPEYFQKLPANYRQRITHDVRLGSVKGSLQDVASLREADDRRAFVARYLNAARSGPTQLSAWREDFRMDRDLAPPNPCSGCARVEACHGTFGEVDGIGLFPFTSLAIDRFFHALKEDDGGMTHRTPRGILQGVLSPTLLHPKALDNHAYPGVQIETSALERPPLPAAMRNRLEAQVPALEDRERLRRLFSYWGDLRPELRRDAHGERVYAGVSEAVVAAFDLPWIAEDVTITTGPSQPTPRRPEPPPGDGEPAPAAPVQPDPPPRRPIGVRPKPGSDIGLPPPRPTTASRSTLEKLRAEAGALRDNLPLQNSSQWNGLLHEVLRKIDLKKLGVDRWTWSKLITAETVKIAGTGQVRGSHFVVERSNWLADGLEAYATLKTEQLSEEEEEFSLRRIAFMIRRLEVLAKEHIERRVPALSKGHRWDPVVTVAQILLARAWLRGATTADRPTHEQWTAILSDESEAESDPAARTQPWQDALSATKGRHDVFRKTLLEMVRLPQGDRAGFGIADASSAAAAILDMIRACELSATPTQSTDPVNSDLEAIREVAGRLSALPAIGLQERKLLSSRAELMFPLLRQSAIRPHVLRLDAIITSVSQQMLNLPPHLGRDWKASLERQRALLDDPPSLAVIEAALIQVTDQADAQPQRGALMLTWLARLPAANLKAMLDLCQLGERTVSELLPHVQDLVRESAGGVDLAAIHRHGTTMRTFAAAARELLGEQA